jgi:hypothetical protein
MKDKIKEVLTKYQNKQINLDSEAAIDMITDELYDELNNEFVVSKKNNNCYWEQGQPGIDY